MENSHTYVVGKSGMGKSTFLENAIFDEIENDRAVFFIDPHGESAQRIADALPRSLIHRSVYIDLSDYHYVGFNPLVNPLHVHTGLKSLWIDNWGPQSDYLLKYALLAVAEYGGTLADIIPMFTDAIHRNKVLATVRTTTVLKFWTKTFREYERSKKEPYLPLINKIDAINTSVIRHVLCQCDTPSLISKSH